MDTQPYLDALAAFETAHNACVAAPSPQTRGARAMAAENAETAYDDWKTAELAERMAEINKIQHPTAEEGALMQKFRAANPQAFAPAEDGAAYREKAMYQGLVLEDPAQKTAAQKADDQHRLFQLNRLKMRAGQTVDLATVEFD